MPNAIMKRQLLTTALCGILLLFGAGLASAQHSYTEDFSTTDKRDAATTADWNTATGELKLFPFSTNVHGSHVTSGTAMSVFVEGHYAFVADFSNGILVFDITDPALPAQVGAYNTSGQARKIQVVGNYAYVADTAAGLLVLDVSDPANPLLAGSIDPGNIFGLSIAGDVAYLAGWSSGLQIVDISDPTNPLLLGAYNTVGTTLDVVVAGGYAYVADFDNGLLVFDVTDPAAPVMVGSHPVTSRANGLDIAGNVLYLATEYDGLNIFDISVPTNPVAIANLDTPGLAKGVTVEGNYAYLSDFNLGWHIIDVTDPGQPALLETLTSAGEARSTFMVGPHAYVADGSNGLQIIEVGAHLWSGLAGVGAAPGLGMGVDVVGDVAFVATNGVGLRALDISDVGSPFQLDVYQSVSLDSEDVVVEGTTAYLSAGVNGLMAFDVSDPSNISLSGGVNTPGHSYGAAVAGNRLYVADGVSGLICMDISDPGGPFAIDVQNTADSAQGVCIAGNYAYVADGNSGLLVIDISNPSAMAQVGSYNHAGYAFGVDVAGNYAFVAVGNMGLQVFDISDPTSPVPTDLQSTSGYVRRVKVVGDRAYVSAGASGYAAYDISDPTNLKTEGAMSGLGYTYGLDVSGDHAFLISNNFGLSVIQVMQRNDDVVRDVGQSADVALATSEIVRYRLNTTQFGYVQWKMRANNWGTWINTASDGSWVEAWSAENALQWQATLYSSVDGPSSVSELTVEWLLAAAKIEAVDDIASDQGGQIRLEWSRSGHDFADATDPITEYAVYRAIDGGLKSGATEADYSGLSVVAADHARAMKAQGWDFLATVPVRQEDRYFYVAPTLADSTINNGQHFSTFMVTALTGTPSVFFDSPPDSGYSVDNLAPGVPTGFVAAYEAAGVTLNWDDAPEADFQHYRVYRGNNPGFEPSTATLYQAVSVSSWIDPTPNAWGYYYKVAALDVAGNESPAAQVETASDVPAGAPNHRFALHNAHPNPFNPRTQIRYSLPADGRVSLVIYDLAGRQVRTLVDEVQGAGAHAVTWDGLNQRGTRVASGVYFYQLQAGSEMDRKRVVMIK